MINLIKKLLNKKNVKMYCNCCGFIWISPNGIYVCPQCGSTSVVKY